MPKFIPNLNFTGNKSKPKNTDEITNQFSSSSWSFDDTKDKNYTSPTSSPKK